MEGQIKKREPKTQGVREHSTLCWFLTTLKGESSPIVQQERDTNRQINIARETLFVAMPALDQRSDI